MVFPEATKAREGHTVVPLKYDFSADTLLAAGTGTRKVDSNS